MWTIEVADGEVGIDQVEFSREGSCKLGSIPAAFRAASRRLGWLRSVQTVTPAKALA